MNEQKFWITQPLRDGTSRVICVSLNKMKKICRLRLQIEPEILVRTLLPFATVTTQDPKKKKAA